MSRPITIEALEQTYETMTQRWLSQPEHWRFDSELQPQDTRTCLAIYTMDHWKLNPRVWQRLLRWLSPLLQEGIVYTPTPLESEGMLHFTFHQCSPFRHDHSYTTEWENHCDALTRFMNPLSGLELEFRGLCVTPTGIALRGFPIDAIQCKRLMETRNQLHEFFTAQGIPFDAPYINDICHATLFRWTCPPSQASIDYIQRTLHTWDEAPIACYCASSWTLGFGTYRMTLPQRKDILTIHAPLQIAHRGLRTGPSKEHENNLTNIHELVQEGIHVECDIWYMNQQLYLGHDAPQTKICHTDLCSPYLWIHAKNNEALEYLLNAYHKKGQPLRIFWHTTEDYCLTTTLDCIVYPGKPLLEHCVFMMPESTDFSEKATISHAVCSDFALSRLN